MKLPTNTPVKIVMLGAGGTGGHIAPHIYRLLYALDRPSRFIICDGDKVEFKNLVRQNFSPADLGENKAKILAERYAAVFGMEAEYLPAFVEDLDTLTTLIHADGWAGEYSRYPTVREQVILIGAVDNDKSRQLCHKAFLKAENLIYIDSGNGEFSGQGSMRCPQEWPYRPKAGGRRIPRATEGAGSVPFGAFLCGSISGRPAEHGRQYYRRYDRGGYGLQYPRQRRMQRTANGLFHQDRPHEYHIG